MDTTRGAGDKNLVGDHAVPALAPRGSHTGTVDVMVLAATDPGTYYLLACADDTNDVTEKVENNNCTASTTTVVITGETRGPDLVETSVTSSRTWVTQGGGLSVTDTAKNQGDATAPASVTRYYLSLDTTKGAGDYLLNGSRSVPILGVDATDEGTADVTCPVTVLTGTYYLLACADDTKMVTEGNENNNCTASGTMVQVMPPS